MIRAAYHSRLDAHRDAPVPRQGILHTEVTWTAGLVAVTFAYAILRYVVVKGIPASEIPLFILNKAISWSALILLSVAIGSRSLPKRRWAGRAGGALAALHVLLTVPLLSPPYFPNLFAGPEPKTWSAMGQVVLLTGALGVTGLAIVAWPSRPSRGSGRWVHRLPPLIVAVAALHCVALGWTSSWNPTRWPGGLPAISLLAFAGAAVGLATWIRRARG